MCDSMKGMYVIIIVIIHFIAFELINMWVRFEHLIFIVYCIWNEQ